MLKQSNPLQSLLDAISDEKAIEERRVFSGMTEECATAFAPEDRDLLEKGLYEGCMTSALRLLRKWCPTCNFKIDTDVLVTKVTVCIFPEGLAKGTQYNGSAYAMSEQESLAMVKALCAALLASMGVGISEKQEVF